ncbi:SDR family oxidoreductase [Phycisphaerales bacterium AB-hyl4]|uniref:SDR family oxidoreductase n=1 Tax=Natronomicrosphaera hydrolytica TaxID=3242702 RepID=A0ABV4U226_9BACT
MANKSKKKTSEKKQPKQKQQRQPGRESAMTPEPEVIRADYRGSGKLEGRTALITGGDSGIGRAVAVAFAREGADVAIVYLEEDKDAMQTERLVEAEGQECYVIRGDVQKEAFCRRAVDEAVSELGRLDVLVNNAAMQFPTPNFEDIDAKQLETTFRTNIFAMFYTTRAALGALKRREGSAIINTTSVTAYRGSGSLVDYSATKGAIVSFTRSLATNLAKEGVRVNAVAPGPIWTPLIPSTFPEEKVEKFGSDTPMGRAGHPSECAPAYVYLASDDSSYVTGQVLHVNGGEIVNG